MNCFSRSTPNVARSAAGRGSQRPWSSNTAHSRTPRGSMVPCPSLMPASSVSVTARASVAGKRGAGCAPLAIGIKPDQFNAMPCTCHSLLFELSPSWPNQLRYHVLPTLNHLGLLHPLKLGSPPSSWLSLIRQQAWNGIWTVHSTYHTCHNVTPQCSPHRHMIWALIVEGLLSTRDHHEALQCCTKPTPIVTWRVRHATWPLPCSTLRTATNLQVGGRHVGATTCGAMEANCAILHGRKAPPMACPLSMGK